VGDSAGGPAWHGPHGGDAGVSDVWAPAGSGRERERGEARDAWASQEKKEAWAEPEGIGTFSIYSNKFN
jgi:hypothetical protein